MTTRRTRPGTTSPRVVPEHASTLNAGDHGHPDADFIMAPTVTLAAAQRAVSAAKEEAERLSVDVCIAASDSAGHLLAFARMDRAPLLCVQLAQDKAFSVSSFGGLPTG